MARKSKGFAELMNQNQPPPLDKLVQRAQSQEISGKIGNVMITPAGEVKMSDVLKAFVQPFLGAAKNHDQREMLIAIAISAWNLSFLPEDRRSSQLEELVNDLCESQDRVAQDEIRAIVTEMIERKQTFFADCQRYILDFEFQETRTDYHLAVMSTEVPNESEPDEQNSQP